MEHAPKRNVAPFAFWLRYSHFDLHTLLVRSVHRAANCAKIIL